MQLSNWISSVKIFSMKDISWYSESTVVDIKACKGNWGWPTQHVNEEIRCHRVLPKYRQPSKDRNVTSKWIFERHECMERTNKTKKGKHESRAQNFDVLSTEYCVTEYQDAFWYLLSWYLPQAQWKTGLSFIIQSEEKHI